MKKIIYSILFTVLVIILIFNISSIYGISIFGYRIYKIGSGSMNPYLKVNDTIIIKESDIYNVNDVITFKEDNEYITHRIISVNGNEFITKGDANNTEDKPISKNQIIGKLVYKFHFMSYLNSIFATKSSWIILFVGGLLVTLLIPNKKE